MCDSVPSARYSNFCNDCVNGESGSSLLIESTDSMILTYFVAQTYVRIFLFCKRNYIFRCDFLNFSSRSAFF